MLVRRVFDSKLAQKQKVFYRVPIRVWIGLILGRLDPGRFTKVEPRVFFVPSEEGVEDSGGYGNRSPAPEIAGRRLRYFDKGGLGPGMRQNAAEDPCCGHSGAGARTCTTAIS